MLKEKTPIRTVAEKHKMTVRAIAQKFNIPEQTAKQWSSGRFQAPDYVIFLIDKCIEQEQELEKYKALKDVLDGIK